MSAQANKPSRIPRSIGAVLAGFVAVVVLSIGTDAALQHSVFPDLANGNASTPVWLFVTGYRFVYTVLGCAIAARLSPNRPMAHALALGFIGFALSLIGIFAAHDAGPAWYPLAVAAEAIPGAWLGGWLYTRRGAK